MELGKFFEFTQERLFRLELWRLIAFQSFESCPTKLIYILVFGSGRSRWKLRLHSFLGCGLRGTKLVFECWRTLKSEYTAVYAQCTFTVVDSELRNAIRARMKDELKRLWHLFSDYSHKDFWFFPHLRCSPITAAKSEKIHLFLAAHGRNGKQEKG